MELCFWSEKEGLQIRIRGNMEEISEPELLEHIVETRFTFLKPVVKAHGWETLTLFRLSRGELRTWSAGKPAGVTEEVGEFLEGVAVRAEVEGGARLRTWKPGLGMS